MFNYLHTNPVFSLQPVFIIEHLKKIKYVRVQMRIFQVYVNIALEPQNYN